MADDQTTAVYYNPGWIATAGGYLHPNNGKSFEQRIENKTLIRT